MIRHFRALFRSRTASAREMPSSHRRRDAIFGALAGLGFGASAGRGVAAPNTAATGPVVVPGGTIGTNTATADGGTTAVSVSRRFGLWRVPLDFGAVGDGDVDDTAALQAWLTAGGGHLPVPPGGAYKVTGTLTVPSGCTVRGAGAASVIRLMLPSGAAVVPLMATARGSSDISLEDFTLDHDGGRYTDPATLKGNPIIGNCLLFMASNSRISGLVVKNAWDNGIGVVDVDLSSGSGSAGKPNGVRIDGVYTMNCGCGIHRESAHPGKIGAGIDVASGADVVVSNCVSVRDYSGYGTDTGGGAEATFVSCTAWATLMDPAHPGNGSGNAFVSQSGQGRFIGCFAFFPGAYGFWFSNGLDSGQAVGCQVKGAGYHGFYVNSGNVLLSACHAQSCGQAAAGTYDGFNVTTTYGSVTDVQVIGCDATDTTGKQRWGYSEVTSRTYTITGGSVIGGRFTGARGSIDTRGSTNVWAPGAAGSFDIDAAGGIALGGYRGAPAVRITPSSDNSNQQRVELGGGDAGQGASIGFDGSGMGQAGRIVNHQKADLSFITGGSVASFGVRFVAGATAFVEAAPGSTRVSLGAAGAGADIDLALAPKGTGAVHMPLQSVRDFASDSAAAAGGVPVGGLYRDGSVLRIRAA